MSQFSIILPVRNGGEYVKLCVDSILQQTNLHFDLLILDNFSTDGTLEWLQTIDDKRVRLFLSDRPLTMEENWGRIKDLPKNEYMTMIGHDDLLCKDYLCQMQLLIEQHPDASLYQSHFDFIDENGKLIRSCKPMEEIQHVADFISAQVHQTLDSMGTGYMFRSKDYDQMGGIPVAYPNLIFADYELWVRLTDLSYKATTKHSCFAYRVHESVSKKTNGDQYCAAFERYTEFLIELSRHNESVRKVLHSEGYIFLTYFCQSLSHRLLKTSSSRRIRSVKMFVKRCRQFAFIMNPDRSINTIRNWKILAARLIDSNFVTRNIFYGLKGK